MASPSTLRSVQCLAGLAVVGALHSVAVAAEVTVATAANFAMPMKALAEDFEQTTGHKITVSVGATGQFYAQIRNGAPFDVLLAADEQTPERLISEGLADPASRFTYATGRLALWSKTPNLIDAEGSILRSAALTRLAIANPKLAPYGAAAIDVLERMGLQASIAPKLVEGANIAQAYQFVASGNAMAGFVAVSQVFQGGRLREGSVWVVPATLHRPIRQDAILLRPGKDKPAALALLGFLKSDPARAKIRAFGYEAP